MKMIRTVMLAVCLCLTLSCVKQPVNVQPRQPAITGDDILRGAKIFAQTAVDAIDQGIILERQLAAEGTIDVTLEPAIRKRLAEGKIAADDFLVRVSKYEHFDLQSKKDIADFLDESTDFVNKMNSEGITRIKNPNSQLIASGIILGFKIAIRTYRGTFDRVK